MKDREFQEIFYSAQSGNNDAIGKILEMFRPLIYKNSFIDGKFDEDCFQELNIKLVNCIRTFKFSPISKEEACKLFGELL